MVLPSPLSVPCSLCGARKDEPCKVEGRPPKRDVGPVHYARWEAVHKDTLGKRDGRKSPRMERK
jgi:hypothetical protein